MQTISSPSADFHCVATLMHRTKATFVLIGRQPLGFCKMIRPRALPRFFAVPVLVPGAVLDTVGITVGAGRAGVGTRGVNPALPWPTAPAVPLLIQAESGVISGSGLNVGPSLSTGAETTPSPRTRGPDADS